MTLNEFFASQLEYEAAPTRKVLERVPMERWDWKPHEKSTAMGALAQHLANLPSWVLLTINQDELDIAPGGKPFVMEERLGTAPALVAMLDTNIAAAIASLKATNDAHLEGNWTLLANGHRIQSWPRRTVLQHNVFLHMAHHRAQLGVYLRLNGVPLPAIYGPSADER